MSMCVLQGYRMLKNPGFIQVLCKRCPRLQELRLPSAQLGRSVWVWLQESNHGYVAYVVPKWAPTLNCPDLGISHSGSSTMFDPLRCLLKLNIEAMAPSIRKFTKRVIHSSPACARGLVARSAFLRHWCAS